MIAELTQVLCASVPAIDVRDKLGTLSTVIVPLKEIGVHVHPDTIIV